MFTKTAFVDAIVDLIVTEDLVSVNESSPTSSLVLTLLFSLLKSLNIIESVPLQRLFLMLLKELKDSDIPHKTTICDRV